MRIAVCVATLMLQQISGCYKPKLATESAKTIYPIHRFERPATVAADIALDTLTGQYCRTWDWGFTKPSGVPSADMQNLPTCLDIFEKYPSQVAEPPNFIPDPVK